MTFLRSTSRGRRRKAWRAKKIWRRTGQVAFRRAAAIRVELPVGLAVLEEPAKLVPACAGRLASKRDYDVHERHTIYGVRLARRDVSRRGPGDFRIFERASEPDRKP